MSITVPPDAFWSCAEIGVRRSAPVRPGETQVWGRGEFDDATVSRRGVSLQADGGAWTVTNRSTSAQGVHLLDLRFGRRQVPPTGSLRLRLRRSWLLLPDSKGEDRPHVVTIGLARPDTRPGRTVVRPSGEDGTVVPGEPAGDALTHGLHEAREIVRRPEWADLAATFARPWFELSTRPIAAAGPAQVAVCLPGHASRGERLLTRLRAALWGEAAKQPVDVLFRLLIEHEVVTWEQVRSVRHAPGCGHTPDQVDPAAHARRRAAGGGP